MGFTSAKFFAPGQRRAPAPARSHREMISEAELMSQFRQHGIDGVAQVQKACIEGDGRISVIAAEPQLTDASGAEPHPHRSCASPR